MAKTLMILEKNNHVLESNINQKGEYILEGTFTEFGKVNRNNRIYEEKDFLPKLNVLIEKIGKGKKILGELDHPKSMESSLKNASHVIESLWYDDQSRSVKGKIRLLNTSAGKEAQALVEDGIPLHISSRATGMVDNRGNVNIRELYTYDLVSEPGFECAELKPLNESLGIEDKNIIIYEMEDTNLNNDPEMNTPLVQSDLDMYSKHVAEEFSKFKDEIYEKLKGSEETIEKHEEEISTLHEYVQYIKEGANEMVEDIDSIYENLTHLINYNENLIDELNTYSTGSEEKASKLEESISNLKMFSQSIVETANKNNEKIRKYFSEMNESIKLHGEYMSMLSEKHNSTVDINSEFLENFVKMHNNLAEFVDFTTETINLEVFKKNENKSDDNKVEDKKVDENKSDDNKVEDKKVDLNENKNSDSYKNSINDQLNILIKAAEEKKAAKSTEHHFLKFLDESRISVFENLEDEKKAKVVEAFKVNRYFGTKDAVNIFESALNEKQSDPLWLQLMPNDVKNIWESLSPEKKTEITLQASVRNLFSPVAIKHFWMTRNFNSETKSIEKLNESKLDENGKVDRTDLIKNTRKRLGLD